MSSVYFEGMNDNLIYIYIFIICNKLVIRSYQNGNEVILSFFRYLTNYNYRALFQYEVKDEGYIMG